MRHVALVLLPEGRTVEDLPMPHGSFYAATNVNLEMLHQAPGLMESCSRKLMQRLLREIGEPT